MKLKILWLFPIFEELFIFALRNLHVANMVVVAQLVRALDCGSRGRRFEPGLSPKKKATRIELLFLFRNLTLQ